MWVLAVNSRPSRQYTCLITQTRCSSSASFHSGRCCKRHHATVASRIIMNAIRSRLSSARISLAQCIEALSMNQARCILGQQLGTYTPLLESLPGVKGSQEGVLHDHALGKACRRRELGPAQTGIITRIVISCASNNIFIVLLHSNSTIRTRIDTNSSQAAM